MTRTLARTETRVAVVCAVILTVAGCSSQPHQPTTDGSPQTAATQPAVTQPPITRPTVAGTAQQSEALDSYVASAQSQIPALVDTFDGTYSEMTISAVHPDTISYHYVYAEQVDAAAAVQYFEGMLQAFQSQLDSQVFPDIARAGIVPSQQAHYSYDNADGSPLWSHTFRPTR